MSSYLINTTQTTFFIWSVFTFLLACKTW